MSAGAGGTSCAGWRRFGETTIGLAFVDFLPENFARRSFRAKRPRRGCATSSEFCGRGKCCCRSPSTLFPSSVPAASELNGLGAVETRLDDWVFETNHATRLLEEHFRVAGLEGFGLSEHPQATAAAGAMVHYLRETSAIGARKPEDAAAVPSLRPAGAGLEHLDRIAYYEQQDAMILDQVTARNLELVELRAAMTRGRRCWRRSTRRRRVWVRACCALDAAAGDFAWGDRSAARSGGAS